MSRTLEWPEDPDASRPADSTMAARLAAQRYGALVTLDPVAARFVVAATDELAGTRHDAADDPVGWFGVARTAAFDALTAGTTPLGTAGGAGGSAAGTLGAGGGTAAYRLRAFEALTVLPAAFRSAVALFHVCDLDLDTVARVEETEPPLAAALVRGAEFVLVHAMAGTLDEVQLAADGRVDLGWLAAHLPDGDADPAAPRAVGLGSLLSSLADAIAPVAVLRPTAVLHRPPSSRRSRRVDHDEVGRARRFVGAAVALAVTGGVAAALILTGNGGAGGDTDAPAAKPAGDRVTTTGEPPKARASERRKGPGTTKAPATTRVRPSTTVAVAAAPSGTAAPAAATGPVTTRRPSTSQPGSTTSAVPPTGSTSTTAPTTVPTTAPTTVPTTVPTTTAPTTTAPPPPTTTAPPTTTSISAPPPTSAPTPTSTPTTAPPV